MKSIIFFIFAAVLGAILTGCGGGGGGGVSVIPDGNSIRPLTAAEQQELTRKTAARYIPEEFTIREFNELRGLLEAVIADFSLSVSPNPNGGRGCVETSCNTVEDIHDIVVLNQNPGAARVVEIRANGVLIDSTTLIVMGQRGTNYLAYVCEDTASATDDYCSSADTNGVYSDYPRVFTLPSLVYTTTGMDIFKFNNRLIGGNSLNYRNLYFNEEQVEFQHAINGYAGITSGYRHFDNADLMYGRLNLSYDNLRLQWTIGDVKSDYYKEEIINGVAFGWQSENFTAKVEKPFGGGDQKWLRLFYKRELK